MLHQMPRFSYKKGVFIYRKDFGMSILTSQQRWYQQNREKVLTRSRRWRLEHPERYRELQRGAKRRKRKVIVSQKAEQSSQPVLVTPFFVPAPGYDYVIHGNYEHFCLARGIDPKKSWTEPTDEYFG